MENKKYIAIRDLDVYKLSRQLSEIGWRIYEGLDWQDKKNMGNQFISSTDSVGANIAEGYGRFHYLDKIKFYYNSRGSLSECADHWIELLNERNKIKKNEFEEFKKIAIELSVKLNRFISSTYKAKKS